MNCQEFKERYEAWLDTRDLLPAELARHRAECPACRQMSDVQVRMQHLLVEALGPPARVDRRMEFAALAWQDWHARNPLWKDVLKGFLWTSPAILVYLVPYVAPMIGFPAPGLAPALQIGITAAGWMLLAISQIRSRRLRSRLGVELPG